MIDVAIWIIIAIACCYEAYAMWTKRPGDTISEIMWTVSARRPIVPFLLGVLMGHFFWQKG